MTPIHKFNNGNCATLCHCCSKIINRGFIQALYCNEICESKHNSISKEYYNKIEQQFNEIKERANNLMRLKKGFKDKQ